MATGPNDPYASVGAMLHALHAREISATELLEPHLARIARHNPIRFAALVSEELGIGGFHAPPGYS